MANSEQLDQSRLSKCYVTGWGRRTESKLKNKNVSKMFSNLSNIFVPESDHSVVLKEINVPLWEQDSCGSALQQQFGSGYSLPETALCAGAEGRDACDVSDDDHDSDDDDDDSINIITFRVMEVVL